MSRTAPRVLGGVVLVVVGLGVAGSAHAGAWVRDAGGTYVKAGMGTFRGANTVAGSPEVYEYASIDASLYAEVGLPGGLGVVTYLPFLQATNTVGQIRYKSRSGGDGQLGVSKRIYQDRFAVSATALVRIPLYPGLQERRADRFAGHAIRFPLPGDGVVDLDGQVDAGTSLPLGSWGGWAQGSVGYRHRFGDFVDGVTWSGQLGVSPKAGDRDLGWFGLDASGIVNVTHDTLTKQWTRFGAFAAVKLPHGIAVEGWAGLIPFARVSQTGAGGGIGVSWTR